MSVELRPHQIKAVEELADGKVLVGGVGTGKTITSLTYFYVKVLGGEVGDFGSIELPMDLYVFTTARKRDELDWQREAAQLGISAKRDCSATGVTITVDSYNNIQKYDDVKGAFIILDEQRMVGSGAWTKSFLKMAKHNRWIMLSATPGDKWEDYIPLFIANGFYKNRTEFKRRHCVYSHFGPYPKLERYVEVGRLIKLRNSILVEMPYERHTTRHIHTTRVDYDKELFERVVKKRWHVYEERPLKDVSELFSVMRKVVNSDASRLTRLRELMESHPRMIVFYNFDYELDLLRTLLSTPSHSQTSPRSLTDGSSTLTEVITKASSTTMDHQQPSLSQEFREPMVRSSEGSPTFNPTKTEFVSSANSTKLGESSCRDRSSITPSLSMVTNSTRTTSGSLQKPHLSTEKDATTSVSERVSHISEATDLLRLENASSRTFGNTVSSAESGWKGRGSRGRMFESVGTDTTSPSSTTCASMRNTTSNNFLDSSFRNTSTESETERCSTSTNSPSGSEKTSTLTSPKSRESSYSVDTVLHQNHRQTSVISSPSNFEMAEWNGHKHEPVPTSERWVYLVQYAAGAEAWNCTATDAMCFYSLTYSYKHFAQAQGRIDRLDTPFSHLHYYVLMSESSIDRAVAKSLRNKQDFNEKDFG